MTLLESRPVNNCILYLYSPHRSKTFVEELMVIVTGGGESTSFVGEPAKSQRISSHSNDFNHNGNRTNRLNNKKLMPNTNEIRPEQVIPFNQKDGFENFSVV